MSANSMKKRAGLTAQLDTAVTEGLTPGGDTNVTANPDTRRTARRHYKPRARKCRCGCGRMVTPTASAPHKRYFEDACRSRAQRRRRAKERKVSTADPILEVGTCQWCGASFFYEHGHDAKFCSPSHRTAAWRQRREASVDALITAGAMDETAAADMVDRIGMKLVTRFLQQKGYHYDEAARRWLPRLHVIDRVG